jgi:PII-like signaling protein
MSEDLPVVVVAVDNRGRIEAALADVGAVANHGLVTLERARMLTGTVDRVSLPEELHEATKLTVYCGRHERVGRRAAFVAIVDLLRRAGVMGAIVMLGVDATAHGVRQRARFFGRNANVPLMIVAIGAGTDIAALLPEIAETLERPLLSSSESGSASSTADASPNRTNYPTATKPDQRPGSS